MERSLAQLNFYWNIGDPYLISGDMDPKGYFMERYRKEEARQAFLRCFRREWESVGGYLSRLSEIFREAHPGGITDTQAVRHLITHLPDDWAICAEQTREYWGRPHWGDTDQYIEFSALSAFLFSQWMMYGSPPVNPVPFQTPLPTEPRYPRFRTGAPDDMDLFRTWTLPSIPGVDPPPYTSTGIVPRSVAEPSLVPIWRTAPYVAEPSPVSLERPTPARPRPSYYEDREGFAPSLPPLTRRHDHEAGPSGTRDAAGPSEVREEHQLTVVDELRTIVHGNRLTPEEVERRVRERTPPRPPGPIFGRPPPARRNQRRRPKILRSGPLKYRRRVRAWTGQSESDSDSDSDDDSDGDDEAEGSSREGSDRDISDEEGGGSEPSVGN